MVAYIKDSSYGCGEGKYSDRGIDLRSMSYFENIRNHAEMPVAGVRDDIYVSRRKILYENKRSDYSRLIRRYSNRYSYN